MEMNLLKGHKIALTSLYLFGWYPAALKDVCAMLHNHGYLNDDFQLTAKGEKRAFEVIQESLKHRDHLLM